MTPYFPVLICLFGLVGLFLTACTSTSAEHRGAISDLKKTFAGFEGGFKRRVANFPDSGAVISSIESYSSDLGENLIGLETRDDVGQRTDFLPGRSGIYAANVAGPEIVLDVLITGFGRLSDWTGQHNEAAYTCVTARAIPPNRDSVSVIETKCPEHLVEIALGPEKKFRVPLQDIIRKESERY